MNTVLCKVYRGTGRPDRFVVIDAADKDEFNRLVSGHGFGFVAERDADYTEGDAWNEFTRIDTDGFTQWA